MIKSPNLIQSNISNLDEETEHLIKLIDRTSEIYKELISKNINTSSAYKLPEKINYLTKSLSKESKFLRITDFRNKHSKNINSNEEKIKVLNLMSICRMTLTNKISSKRKSRIKNSFSPLNHGKSIFKQTSDFLEDYCLNKTENLNNVDFKNHKIDGLHNKNLLNPTSLYLINKNYDEDQKRIFDFNNNNEEKNLNQIELYNKNSQNYFNNSRNFNSFLKLNGDCFSQNFSSNKDHQIKKLNSNFFFQKDDNFQNRYTELEIKEDLRENIIDSYKKMSIHSDFFDREDFEKNKSCENFKLKDDLFVENINFFYTELDLDSSRPIYLLKENNFDFDQSQNKFKTKNLNSKISQMEKNISFYGKSTITNKSSRDLLDKSSRDLLDKSSIFIIEKKLKREENVILRKITPTLNLENKSKINNLNDFLTITNKNEAKYLKNKQHINSIILKQNKKIISPNKRIGIPLLSPKKLKNKYNLKNSKSLTKSLKIKDHLNNYNLKLIQKFKVRKPFSDQIRKVLKNDFLLNSLNYKNFPKMKNRRICYSNQKLIDRLNFSNYNLNFENKYKSGGCGDFTLLKTKENEIFCRICKEDNNESNNSLITICMCTGNMKYMHILCSSKYIRDMTIFKENSLDCEICKNKYLYIINKKYEWRALKNSLKFIRFLMKLLTLSFIAIFIKFLLPIFGLLIVDEFINNIFFFAVFFLIISLVFHYIKILGFDILETWIFFDISKLKLFNGDNHIKEIGISKNSEKKNYNKSLNKFDNEKIQINKSIKTSHLLENIQRKTILDIEYDMMSPEKTLFQNLKNKISRRLKFSTAKKFSQNKSNAFSHYLIVIFILNIFKKFLSF